MIMGKYEECVDFSKNDRRDSQTIIYVDPSYKIKRKYNLTDDINRMGKGLVSMIKGSKLRKLREELGIPIGYLANALGISISALIAIERGKKQLTRDQLSIISGIFNMTIAELIARK
jgi:DNA-binding XRE family transcriptional regulator